MNTVLLCLYTEENATAEFSDSVRKNTLPSFPDSLIALNGKKTHTTN